MYVVRKNSLALPHCDENDCKQYFFHSQHFQSLSFSTLKRPKSEKKTVKINQKGDIIAGLSLSDLAKRLKAHEWYTSFVLFPQASEPSVNFNISKLVNLGIHTYQRNFCSHVTVGMSARPSVRRHHRLTNVKWHFVVRVGACNLCLLDDKHPCLVNWQLSAKGYPLTSIAWPYRRLRFQLEVKYFIFIFRWPVICF